MEQNKIIIDYIRSLFDNEFDQELVTLLWECDKSEFDDLLMQILEQMEEHK